MLFRSLPSYEVVQGLGLLNTYTGLILPLIASATGTFFFRQFFRSIPDELIEAARIDGAGPVRFFIDILVPLSKTMIAAIFIIMFVVGWNQYLWPLLIITDPNYGVAAVELSRLVPNMNTTGGDLPNWHWAMAGTLIVMLPPVAVVCVTHWYLQSSLTRPARRAPPC